MCVYEFTKTESSTLNFYKILELYRLNCYILEVQRLNYYQFENINTFA